MQEPTWFRELDRTARIRLWGECKAWVACETLLAELPESPAIDPHAWLPPPPERPAPRVLVLDDTAVGVVLTVRWNPDSERYTVDQQHLLPPGSGGPRTFTFTMQGLLRELATLLGVPEGASDWICAVQRVVGLTALPPSADLPLTPEEAQAVARISPTTL